MHPRAAKLVLSVSEFSTIFIKSLIQSKIFGKKFQGAVITILATFTDSQHTALEKAATDANANALQLLDETSAAAATSNQRSLGL